MENAPELPAPRPPLDLFTAPMGAWDYRDVDAFLNARIAENSTVEYKADHTTNLVDTLVAFANGDSPGLIFIGVSEAGPQKVPRSWPELPAGKDQLAPVYSKAAAETIPAVRLEARAFRDDSQGKELVAIRVPPGLHPPYFGKGRGVKVRSGDQDIDADPRTLEALFSRRTEASEAAAQHRQQLAKATHRRLPGNADQLMMSIRVAPLVGGDRAIVFDTFTGRAIQALLRDLIPFIGTTERRGDNQIEFSPPPGSEVLTVTGDGAIEFLCGFADGGERNPIPSQSVVENAYAVLRFAKVALSDVAGYSGPLYAGVYFSSLDGRAIAWPPNTGFTVERHRAEIDVVYDWAYDSSDFDVSKPVMPLIREALKSLAWRLGYSHHEGFIDRWGSATAEN